MTYETIISVQDLIPNLFHPDWCVIDCRTVLEEPGLGFEFYCQSHIPGALYADLERDLCGQPNPGKTSRHPFPDPDIFAQKLSAWGVDKNVQVVVYDDADGGYAVRLWRMLGWMGHRAVALLDGGLNIWEKQGLALETGENKRPKRNFIADLNPHLLISSPEVSQIMDDPAFLLLDARSSQSYSGEKDPNSPTCGHIPGAIHFQYTQNLDREGLLLPIPTLIQRYKDLLNGKQAVVYCTSGVTASLNVLAIQHAGLGRARLFAGSWDEWISDSTRPVEKSYSNFGD